MIILIHKICANLLLILLSTGFSLYAQKTTKIEIINANTLEYNELKGDKIRKLIGNVVFKQDSIYLYCDSAYSYVDRNCIDAFSNVHMVQGDTLHLYCDTLKYDGDTKKGKLFSNIRLQDQDMTLTTQRMHYDTDKKLAYYFGGGKIVNKENNLTSAIGYYYSNTKTFFFKDSVVLINPDYIMNADTLQYDTNTETAYFHGPTNITSNENVIYCHNGWYDTRYEISQFSKNAILENKEQQLKGDSLFYNRKTGFGQAFRNIVLTDTAKKMIIYGDYAEYHSVKDSTFIIGNTMLVNVMDKDSLFLHADTLLSKYDSLLDSYTMFAFHRVKFYKPDLQGSCDSLVYSFYDSTMRLYRNPVIWSEENQLTADFITAEIKNDQINSIGLYNAAFIVSQDTIEKFNQIKGKNMHGYFTDNHLYKMYVNGNGQSLYYIKEEGDHYTGVNKAECSDITLLFEDNKAQQIIFIANPEATYYPIQIINAEELILKGFQWLDQMRPKSKEEIFR